MTCDDYLRQVVWMMLCHNLPFLSDGDASARQTNKHAWLVDEQAAGLSLQFPVFLFALLDKFLVLLSVNLLLFFEFLTNIFRNDF